VLFFFLIFANPVPRATVRRRKKNSNTDGAEDCVRPKTE